MAPGLAARTWGSRFDWNLTTTPQAGFNNRSSHYTRGRVLGGSTSLNEMAWCRGSKDDYDRWARVTADPGWSWNSIFPYFFNKLDRVTPPADGHDTSGQFDPALHGKTGAVNTSLYGFALGTVPRSIAASRESPRFPFNRDYNSGDPIGISYVQQTISRGTRVTSYAAYIAPALARSNLEIAVNTYVTRVLQTGTQDGLPIVRGVEVLENIAVNSTITLKARRQVILSAGAIKSPHILLASGIGDAAHIRSLGIQSLVHLPDVGQNLQDHVFTAAVWNVRPNVTTYDPFSQNATIAAEALAEWQMRRTGPLTVVGAATWGFFRIPTNSTAFAGGPDPSAGPTSAHYEMVVLDQFGGFFSPEPATGNFLTIQIYVLSPTSRGSITLASADPRVAPLINPNYLASPVDRAIAREAIRSARSFLSQPAWKDWVTNGLSPADNATTDAELDAFFATQSTGGLHMSGTVAMGISGTSKRGSGALNPDLTVKGTVGLRVVDTSAFPFVISGHTQAPAYALAERAADLIKRQPYIT